MKVFFAIIKYPLVVSIILSCIGCFSMMSYGLVLHPRKIRPADCNTSPRFSEYKIKNIAVLPFKPSAKTESGDYTPPFAELEHKPIPKYVHLANDSETAAQLIEKELLQTFIYQPVERRKLDQVLKEIEFQLSDLVSSDTVKQVGNLTGADAVLTGTVNQAMAALQWQSYGDIVYTAYIGYVHIELRLTHVETGDVIWLCDIQRNSLNYITNPITIAQSEDIRHLQQFGGPGERDVVMFVMRKVTEEAVAGLK